MRGGGFVARLREFGLTRLGLRLARDCRGNMVLIAAGMLVAVVAVGFGLDYGRAIALRGKLAEAGHAAAMSAVSTAMQAQDSASAQKAAVDLFMGQVSGLPGLGLDPATGLQVSVVDGAGSGAGLGRQVVVRWSATYATMFGGLLGAASLPVVGSAEAHADGAALVDFTLALAPSSGAALQEMTQAAKALVPVAQKLAGQNGVAYPVGIISGGVASGYAGVLTGLGGSLPVPGDGARADTARQVVLLVVDSLPDVASGVGVAACDAIKDRGIVLGVLLLNAGGGASGGAVAVGQACASAGLGGGALFVQQGKGQASGDALASLFAMAAANARLVH